MIGTDDILRSAPSDLGTKRRCGVEAVAAGVHPYSKSNAFQQIMPNEDRQMPQLTLR